MTRSEKIEAAAAAVLDAGIIQLDSENLEPTGFMLVLNEDWDNLHDALALPVEPIAPRDTRILRNRIARKLLDCDYRAADSAEYLADQIVGMACFDSEIALPLEAAVPKTVDALEHVVRKLLGEIDDNLLSETDCGPLFDSDEVDYFVPRLAARLSALGVQPPVDRDVILTAARSWRLRHLSELVDGFTDANIAGLIDVVLALFGAQGTGEAKP